MLNATQKEIHARVTSHQAGLGQSSLHEWHECLLSDSYLKQHGDTSKFVQHRQLLNLISFNFNPLQSKMAPHVIEGNGQAIEPTSKSIAAKDVPVTTLESPSTVQNLAQLLAKAAASTAGLTFYTPGAEVSCVSYAELQSRATEKARLLSRIDGISASSIILLHFENHHDTILWFWAATLTGLLPAISTPFVHDPAQRMKHLRHLKTLLQEPVVLTTERLVPDFLDTDELRVLPVEVLDKAANSDGLADRLPLCGAEKQAQDPAVLMLTSGSTGSAKAVPLRHGQLLTALQGKKEHHGTEPGDVFLTWVGLDHVASLCEIHLHASP